MARIKAPVVITANDLLSGEVVYLDASHRWSAELSAAKVFTTIEEAESELAAAFDEAAVVGAYLAEVTEGALTAPGNIIARAFVIKVPATTFTASRPFRVLRWLLMYSYRNLTARLFANA